MAAKANTTRKRVRSTIEIATGKAQSRLRAVQALSTCLADEMQKIHGGEWRIQIDHEVGLIAIAQRAERHRSPRPQPGVLV